jgi:hypothetical protein
MAVQFCSDRLQLLAHSKKALRGFMAAPFRQSVQQMSQLNSEEYLTRKKVNFDDPTTASISTKATTRSVSCHTSSILMTTTINPIVESASGPTGHLI